MNELRIALLVWFTLGSAAPALAAPPERFCPSARDAFKSAPIYSTIARRIWGEIAFTGANDKNCVNPVAFLRYQSGDVFMTSRGDPGVACHACDTSLSAWFFAHSPAGPKLVAWDRDFMRAGTFGFAGELKKIRIGGDDGVVLETGGTFQGETFVALYVFVFSNGKAILLNKDPIPLSHDNEGANGDQNPEALIDISGDWKIDGDELVINYTNRSKGKLEKSRVSWKREGNRLVKITGDPPEP